MFKNFLAKLGERKTLKWFTIHISTSLTTFGAVNLFGTKYNFPPELFDIIVFASLCSLPIVLVAAWFHGLPGSQKFKIPEILFYLFMFSIFLTLVSFKLFSGEEEEILLVEKSIAVLPFQNFSGSPEDEFFSNGVTEDILTQLSKIGDLQVVSRTSSMKYKNSDKSIREIAKELGVENVLEGSVRRTGNRVRIVSQLIDARTDKHIWAETYDRELKDIFQIQSDVAQKIADQLKAKLSQIERERIQRQSTNNIDAYTLYLKGKEYYYRYSKDDNEISIDFFNRAIKLDPEYALAYAGLADAFAQRFAYFDMGKEWIDSSRAMSLKAIGYDSDIAEPYKSLAMSYIYSGKLNKAIEYYLKTIQINPNFAVAVSNLAATYWLIGNYPEAKKWLDKSISLEATRPFNYRFLGLVYQGLGKFDLAETSMMKVVELQPDLTFVISDLTKNYIITGQFDKARKFLGSAYEKKPRDRRVLAALGDVELYSGNIKKAGEYYKSAIDVSSVELGPGTELAYVLMKEKNKEYENILSTLIKTNYEEITNGNEDFNYAYDLSRLNAIKGDKEKALEYLELAMKNGFRFYQLPEKDPIYEKLWKDPRFRQIMDWMKTEVQRMADELFGR